MKHCTRLIWTVLASLFPTALPTVAQTPPCGTTISAAGTLVTFDSDLICPPGFTGYALHVEADDVVVDGAGFAVDAPDANRLISVAEANGVTIENLDLSDQPTTGVVFEQVSGSTIRNVDASGIGGIGARNGIYVGPGSHDNLVIGNTVHDRQWGIKTAETFDSQYTSNDLTDNVVGLHSTGGNGNSFTDNDVSRATSWGVLLDSEETPTFGGNVYMDCYRALLIAEMDSITLADLDFSVWNITATVLNLSLTNSTITGVNASGTSGEGAGIYLGPGSRNNVVSNNTVHGRKWGISAVETLDSQYTGNDLADNQQGLSALDGRGNVVTDNTVSRATSWGVVLAREVDVTLEGTVYLNCEQGLSMTEMDSVTLSDLDFSGWAINRTVLSLSLTNSTITRVDASGISGLGSGIHLGPGSRNNMVSDNTVHGRMWGISTSETLDSQFSDNDLTDNENGLESRGGRGNSYIANDVSRSTSWGIVVEEESALVQDNTCDGSLKGIVLVDGIGGLISGNHVTGAEDRGIYLNRQAGPEVRDNLIADGLQDGLVIWDSTDVVLYHNNVFGNDRWQVNSNGPIELSHQGEGGFWGRSEPGNLFVAGEDSNSPDVVDSFPYCAQDGWLFGLDPGACSTDLPTLTIPQGITAAAGEGADVPVELAAAGWPLAGVAFSVDYDESCLGFDPADADTDGLPDAIAVHVPADFQTTITFDPADTDGEIDVSIADIGPSIATLPDGPVVSITLSALCPPPPGSPLVAPVGFSDDPAASFSDNQGQDVDGLTRDGWVEIFGGVRGDCNGNNTVTVADEVALGLEIFDGDGSFWLDAAGGTYPGSPVGCDANADTAIDAGDLSCVHLLIFGGTCAAESHTPAPMTGPELTLAGGLAVEPGQPVWVAIDFAAQGSSVNSVAFSLDLDPSRFWIDPRDSDGDGVPDAVRLLNPPPLAAVSVDVADAGGEIDFLFADLAATLAEGELVAIELLPLATGQVMDGLDFSLRPSASFGGTDGVSVPGRARVAGSAIFADGFESGDLAGGWTVQSVAHAMIR